MIAWLAAFALTVGLEAPIAAALLPRGRPPATTIAVIVGAQLATHPLVWWLAPLARGPGVVAAAELAATAAEAALYAILLRAGRRALVASVAANAASCSLGLAITALFT